ncbi:MAG TPA: peptidase C39 family protein [Chloroflexota bacterium]|nr:peptidase C39 family protein [Chloroflexota bacterium]
MALALAWATPAAAAGPFEDWSLQGAGVVASQAQLAPSATQLNCQTEAVDGSPTGFDRASGLCRGSDTSVDGAYYNGGSFVFGTMTSPPVSTPAMFDRLVGSWDAFTPTGTWIELHARVQQAPGWSRWYALPVWASDTGTIKRHSVNGQKDDRADVQTDTLIPAAGLPASAYQLEVTLFSASADASPAVKLVDASTLPEAAQAEHQAGGVELPVPRRSQMLPEYQSLGFGGGGEAWCSPTSTSMIMAYWAGVLHLPQLDLPVPQVAAGTYDYTYGGAGNWPFNTAFAGSYGLTAYVDRLASFDQVEAWIRAGVPIAISIAFRPGDLPQAPIPSSPGHLLVVRGFTPSGDVIVNDPVAATDAQVRMVYDRSQLEHAWQHGSGGTVYVIYPPGWQTPA